MSEKIIIDGEGEVLGRVASFAAKKALQGHEVVITNCNSVLVSGNKNFLVDHYLTMRRRTKVRFPSTPEMLMKRTVRGMINYKSGRGALAFKKLRCHSHVPVEYKDAKGIKLGNKNKRLMNLKELSQAIKQR